MNEESSHKNILKVCLDCSFDRMLCIKVATRYDKASVEETVAKLSISSVPYKFSCLRLTLIDSIVEATASLVMQHEFCLVLSSGRFDLVCLSHYLALTTRENPLAINFLYSFGEFQRLFRLTVFPLEQQTHQSCTNLLRLHCLAM
jgi:hypothetical protein